MFTKINRFFSNNKYKRLLIYLKEENDIYKYEYNTLANITKFNSFYILSYMLLIKSENYAAIELYNNYFYQTLIGLNIANHNFINKNNLVNFKLFQNYLIEKRIGNIDDSEVKLIYKKVNYLNAILCVSSLYFFNYEYSIIVFNIIGFSHLISDYLLKDYRFDNFDRYFCFIINMFLSLIPFLFTFYMIDNYNNKIKLINKYEEENNRKNK